MADLKLKLKIDTREANRAIEGVRDYAVKEFRDLKEESLAAETVEQMESAISKLDDVLGHLRDEFSLIEDSLNSLYDEWERRSDEITARVLKDHDELSSKLFKEKYGTAYPEVAIENTKLSELQELADTISKCTSAQKAYNQQIEIAESLRRPMVQKEKALMKASAADNTFVKELQNSLRRVPAMIGNAFRKGMSIAKRVAGSLFSYLGNGLRNSLGTAGGLIDLFTSKMTRVGIAMMGIQSLFSGLRKAISSYLSDNEATANKLTSLWVSIGNALGPIIDWIADKIMYLIGILNGLLNVLFGVNLKVKQVASSAGSAGGALGNAGSAAKKAAAELAAFDEINKLSDPDSGSGSGGGGGGGGSGSSYVDLEPIDIGLKDLIEAGDWEGVGALFADKLNALMEKGDDWINNTFAPWAKTWAERLGRIINGFVEEFDWQLLGKTIGDGLNAIIDALNTFYETVDFNKLGEKLGEAITSLFSTVDWDALAEFFANKLNAFWQTVNGLVTKVFEGDNAVNAGKTISDAIKTWFDKVDWESIGNAIVTGFNGVITTLTTAITDESTKKLITSKLKTLFDKLGELDVSGLADSLSQAVIDALDILTDSNAISTAGRKFGEFFGNIQWGNLLENALNAAWEFIKAAWSGFWGGEHASELAGVLLTFISGALALNTLTFSVGGVTVADAAKTTLLEAVKGFIAPALEGLGGVISWSAGLLLTIPLAIGLDMIFMNDENQEVVDTVEQSKKAGLDYNEYLEKYGDPQVAEQKYKEDMVNWYKENKPSVEVTATATEFNDNINEKDKNVNKVTAQTEKLDQTKLSTEQKTLSGITAGVNSVSNSLTKKQKTLTGMTASLSSAALKKGSEWITAYAWFKKTWLGKNDNRWVDVYAWFTQTYLGKNNNRWVSATAEFISYIAKFGRVKSEIEITGATVSAAVREKMSQLLGKAEGGILVGGRWQKVQSYAFGGSQSMGQLFIAREAGPELVGTIGGHSAVMNNNQIVSSVAAGVAAAVSGVLSNGLVVRPMASAASYSGGMGIESMDIDSLMERFAGVLAQKLSIEGGVVKVYLDGKQVTETVNTWNKKLSFAGNI